MNEEKAEREKKKLVNKSKFYWQFDGFVDWQFIAIYE